MKTKEFIKIFLLLIFIAALPFCARSSDEKIKIVVIGFDGAGWPTIEPLINNGRLPYLKKLRDESAWADFKTFKPTKSNVVWTSIVTGKTMMKHGIMDFTFLKKNGVRFTYNKSHRKEPAIWQILDSFGMKSIVINWWVSHPPDKVNGIILSDRFRRVVNNGIDVNGLKDTVYPQSMFQNLTKLVKENSSYEKVLERTGLTDFPKKFHEKFPKGNIKKIPVLNIYRRLVKHDAMIESVSEYLHEKVNCDLFATYFRSPDITQHLITHFMDQGFKAKFVPLLKKGNVPPEMMKEAVNMVSELMYPVYRNMERIIKNIIEGEKNKNTYFMIMSDHGFSFFKQGYNHYNLPKKYEPPAGILMIKGPKVKKGKLVNASVFDITPTILNLFGLPVGKNMDGKVLKSAFRKSNKISFKLYKLRTKKETGSGKVDKEALEELKAIGYIN